MTLVSERSYERLTEHDLTKLTEIAAADRADRFRRMPRWSVYRDRVICVALCQGAALHYVDGRNGVKDIDVWTFFAEHHEGPFPYRWATRADFGKSHLGRRQSEPSTKSYTGRRVDLIGRSLTEPVGANPIDVLTRYLRAGRTETAQKLAEKAVVLLEPEELRGTVVWPPAPVPRPPL